MPRARVGLFDDAPDLDLSGFAARRPEDSRPPPAPGAVRRIAEAHHFISREGRPDLPPARRHRTGRNLQLNIKARPDTVATFYRITDQHGWLAAETLEHALAALERELAAPDKGR